MPTSDPSYEPEGPPVTPIPAEPPSTDTILDGKHVTVKPLLESHVEKLYSAVGGAQNANLYKYMSTGPFYDVEAFAQHADFLCQRTVLFPYTIFSKLSAATSGGAQPNSSEEHTGTATGLICLLNIVPIHRSIEIGYLLFGPHLQRTTAATETCYLLMKHCFEDLHYLRVEWKTNCFNEASKRAALRLGFVFEGVFRKHMVVKGRSRDSAWFSVTDEEWAGGVKKALEDWLRNDNFDEKGIQKIKLEDIRRRLVKKNA